MASEYPSHAAAGAGAPARIDEGFWPSDGFAGRLLAGGVVGGVGGDEVFAGFEGWGDGGLVFEGGVGGFRLQGGGVGVEEGGFNIGRFWGEEALLNLRRDGGGVVMPLSSVDAVSLLPLEASNIPHHVGFNADNIPTAAVTVTATAANPPTTSPPYQPDPDVLARNPVEAVHPADFYRPLSTSQFRTSAEAKAHRRRACIAPKAQAEDVARVKATGRDYWVCRLYNSMINGTNITDSTSSIHRKRFTTQKVFDSVDLEAAAHHVFDEAIAVHERGWNRPKVYHKNTVRGKMADISGKSVELRLSRICFVLARTKSAVDDAVRGGVTLALLCDNPEARRATKESNDAGNRKRGERLKKTASKERARGRKVEDVEDVDDGEAVETVEAVEEAVEEDVEKEVEEAVEENVEKDVEETVDVQDEEQEASGCEEAQGSSQFQDIEKSHEDSQGEIVEEYQELDSHYNNAFDEEYRLLQDAYAENE